MNKLKNKVYIPHDVIGIQLIQECSLLTAWRKHQKLTLSELSTLAGVTEDELSKIERVNGKVPLKTLVKVASAMNLSVEQIKENA